MSEGAFLQDLAMLMAVAGSVSLLFARFKWPKAVGYIMAGVLLSRHTWGGSFLLDESSVQTAGQLGIVFLMFSMGLGLSTTQLKRVGNVAMPTALLDTVMMMWLGYTVGHRFLGWGTVPSLFLGAAICDSATTLLAKIIGEMGWEGRSFVRYALGTSVCEDIVCVGVMAVIAGVANGGGVDMSLALRSMGGIAVFFIATFVFGLVLVPRLLTSVAKRGDDEALLITLLGCCFFVTYVAYRLDYSFALGAFVVGVLGASSEARPRLERLVSPLRNMFAATFFVSVGLLVNPAECWAHLPAILGISALVVFGKFLNCTVGALACGTGLKTSVQMGMSLAQTGEFAYMAALLYVTITGDAEKPLYQVAVGVSLLTTILNPLMIRLSDRFGTWVEENCPARLAKALAAYRGAIERYRTSGADARRRSVRRQVLQLAVAAVLVFAVSVSFSMLENRDWSRLSAFFESHKRLFFALAMNAVIATVLAITVRIAKSMAASLADTIVGTGRAKWQNTVRSLVRHVVMTAVMALATLQVIMVNLNFAPEETWARIVIALAIASAMAFGWRFFVRAGRRAAKNFTAALKTDERLARLSREVTITIPEDVISNVVVGQTSAAIGFTIGSLGVRAKTGATIAAVDRDGKRIRNVGPAFKLRAGDVLIAMGDRLQISQLRSLLEGGT